MSTTSQFSKIPKQDKTIFAIVSELAKQNNAIDLSNSCPDFDVDQKLIELVSQHLNSGNNWYAPIEGIPVLREILASSINEKYNTNYKPESEITITNGATDAIFTSITTFIREKDEVIIFEPAYNAYAPTIRLNGGIPVYIDMKSPKFHFDWEKVQLAITANTRMIIINNPHNPTGTTISAWDIEKIKKIVRGTDILILSDEVYDTLVYDGFEHESLAKEPSLHERTLIVNSFSKTFNISGWRLGYLTAPQNLSAEFRKIHQFSSLGCNAPLQYAFAEYLKQFNAYKEITQLYEHKRNLLYGLLKNSKYELKKTKGTLFQCIDYSAISDESDFEFSSRLIRDYKVATIPISYLYKNKTDNKIIRLNFAKHDDNIKQAVENLLKC